MTGVGLWGKRSLHDTPYSMSVVSSDLIENIQANDVQKIFKLNPITQDSGASTNIYATSQANIRGFDSGNIIVNGMLFSNVSYVAPEELDRVEIISGATGFLYGGGRVGGAVNYITKKPTLEDKRNITIGNYGGENYYSHIDLGGQIDEKNIFGYRVNLLYQDGEQTNGVKKEQKLASVVFDWKPTDNFTMDLQYTYRDLKEKAQRFNYSGQRVGATRPTFDADGKYNSDNLYGGVESNRVITGLKWYINDNFTLRGNIIYDKGERIDGQTMNLYSLANGLYEARIWRYNPKGSEYENITGNIYLDSRFDTFGIEHTLTVGASQSSGEYYRSSVFNASALTYMNVSLSDLKNLPITSTNAFDGSSYGRSSKSENKNILIGDDIVFNEQWSALLGANYTTLINKSYDETSGDLKSKYDESKLTPTFSLMYKPFENLTTYVTYIESFLQGAQIPIGSSYKDEGKYLDPYKAKQYEVGAKYSLNESVLLTGALFRIEKANIYMDTASTPKIYSQDGEQVHQGLELTATGKITDNLTVVAGGTLMDIEVTKSGSPDKSTEGKKPQGTASKMAKLYAEYNIPFIQGLSISCGAYYTGKVYNNALNTEALSSYTVCDAGLRYKTKLDKFPTTFLLNVANLTDKNYWANTRFLGDPRTISFSMKMEF
ncbi:TonB-dependent siderophore receptor [Aliarcobacter lanthieri]|uniref:TonB-dependent receptor n=1 Tax=Aliarcobacter lanthieri TaxID=1355374 RepID=UPI0030B85316